MAFVRLDEASPRPWVMLSAGAGKTDFINVLGPVYHYTKSDRGESTSVLWPIWHQFDGPQRESWSLFPLLARDHTLDEEGEFQIDHVESGETVGDVLRYVGYHRGQLMKRIRRRTEQALRE